MILGVKVESDVPLPRAWERPASGCWKDILLEMRVGDSFEVPLQNTGAIFTAARKLRMRITTKKGKGAKTLRVWRVA